MAALKLDNLTKQFPGGFRAVDGLSLEVADGELMVLVGPSGCGKTTTLRMIAGLERPTAGSVCIAGRNVDDLAPKDRDVAMVFQNHVLYPHLNVAGNLAFGLKLRRTNKDEIRRRVREVADVLGIEELLHRRPGQLSGGEVQRVALGRAIVRRPGLFLFDEPLSNLDAGLRSQMRREIRRLHARLGTAMAYVTHDQTEAMTLGQRIAVLCDGRLQQVADPATLYARPANRFVASLIGSPAMNFFDGWVERHEGKLSFASVATVSFAADGTASQRQAERFRLPIPAEWTSRLEPYIDRPVTLGVRPEHIGPSPAEPSVVIPRIPAVVEVVEPLGAETYVHLNTGSQSFVSRMGPGCGLTVGEQVETAVAVAHLHFFDPQTEQTVG
ncbi:MAG: sn-glycerol-3-phosphate ABC transporter ATP-binding protein UgpC [Candidatus Nealsonbacteria bacterium]|nr:sn-glycerol-3-phosphate ABC transporter ATP-binding protein UgpC [Candidatus Nealsonbacteria bacterium]